MSIQRGTSKEGFVALTRPQVGDAEIAEVADSLRSGWLVSGPKVELLERMLEARLGVTHVRCLSGCSAGLFLGLKLAGVGPGDEVLIPTLTFVGCANVVEQLGAVPVPIDSEPETGLIDLDAVERTIGPRTKAMMPVHLGGRPVDMARMNALRDRHEVAVVEDAAHAIGAVWGGVPIGAHGNPTAFSFHASKNMTTGEGGALAVHSSAHAERVQRLAGQGLTQSSWNRHGSRAPADYDVVEPGFKLAMSDIEAALGIHQLPRLDAWIERREELARRYDESLETLPLDTEPPLSHGARHARHFYAVRVRPDAPLSRDELIVRLREANIGSSVHFKPLHFLTYYRERYGLSESAFPAASDFSRRTISLPLHPGMTEADQDAVVDVLGDSLS
jgi:dTDP-4-amino-4,6-dideoxygalactose transaminase